MIIVKTEVDKNDGKSIWIQLPDQYLEESIYILYWHILHSEYVKLI